MAQSGINIGTDALPSIFKILGLSDGDSTDALASAAGGNSSALQPPPNPVPFAPSPEDTMPQQPKSVPTKLGRLQQIIQASQGNIDHPTMTDEHSSPMTAPDPTAGLNQPQMPPPDLVQSMAAGTAQIKPTFQEAHPTLLKIIKGLATTAEGGLAGTGAMTAGQGFQQAKELTDPIRKKMEDAALAEKQAQTAHQVAVTKQMGDMVTLPNGLTVPYDMAKRLYPTIFTEQGKNSRNQANIDSREGMAADKNALALRKQGLKLDANGKQVPLSRDEMSESEQATLDLKQSQQDAAAARAELDRQKNDPNSAAYKAAMGRLQVAAKNAETAAGRLGLAKDTFNANYFGTGPTGEALPGAQRDEQGKPIGPRMATAGKMAADVMKRGYLAKNAIHNLDNIAEIVNRRGDDLFGPIMGRITNVRDMMGSDDPDIAAAGVQIHNYALASNGAHGVRSQGAVEKTEDEILKHFKRGTVGAMGGINAAKNSLTDFIKDAKLDKPAGSATGQPQATHVYNPDGSITPIAPPAR